MITAERRGVVAGSESVRKHASSPAVNLTDDDIRGIGRLVFQLMYKAGYAHIDPESEFIDGFVVGFRNACSTNC
jgi:hypothetical protein